MRKRELTEFGKEVKFELILRNQSQDWLIEQVKARSGLYFDGGYLYKILTGERNAPEIKKHIREILGLRQDPNESHQGADKNGCYDAGENRGSHFD